MNVFIQSFIELKHHMVQDNGLSLIIILTGMVTIAEAIWVLCTKPSREILLNHPVASAVSIYITWFIYANLVVALDYAVLIFMNWMGW